MSRRASSFRNFNKQKVIHGTLVVAWVLLIVPTLLLWSESILWVAFMSLYANISSHWAAFEAAKPDKEKGD